MTNHIHNLDHIDQQLSDRDRQIVSLVARLSLLSGLQIRTLCFQENEKGRDTGQVARRALLRLSRLGALSRLARRVGGTKGGSDGFIYCLGPVGQRLIRRWSDQPTERGRARPEPGARFVTHRLAVSELFVRLVDAARGDSVGGLEVLEFQAEPDCWRPFTGPGITRAMLKPDAFIRLGVGDDELWWFAEVDRGTVSQSTRAAQAAAYRAYWRSGAAGEIMPRVLWLGSTPAVAERARVALQPEVEPAGLFVTTTLDEAVAAATDTSSEVSA